jgi:hypothetical protein
MNKRFSFDEPHQGYQMHDVDDATPDAHAAIKVDVPNALFKLIKICKKIQDEKNGKFKTDVWPAPGLDDTDLSEFGSSLELHRA